jgi:transcriptional regulator of acetoin/glycerol metabolism
MGDGLMMLPVRGGDAYLLLEGVDTKRIDVNTAASMGAVASKAMARTDYDRREARSPDNARRDELLASLTLHEWNIARVARAQGVTRKTIYEWMARYAIRRERVVRS